MTREELADRLIALSVQRGWSMLVRPNFVDPSTWVAESIPRVGGWYLDTPSLDEAIDFALSR